MASAAALTAMRTWCVRLRSLPRPTSGRSVVAETLRGVQTPTRRTSHNKGQITAATTGGCSQSTRGPSRADTAHRTGFGQALGVADRQILLSLWCTNPLVGWPLSGTLAQAVSEGAEC